MSDEEDVGGDGGGGEKPRADGVSEKQLNYIRALQRQLALDDAALEGIARDVAGVEALEGLDRRQASEVIDELKVVGREKGIDLDAQPKASEKQVGFMRSLKRRAHLTDDEFKALLEDKAGVTEPEEVGKRDASAIIDELLARADGKKGEGGAAPKKAAPKKAGAEEKAPPAHKKLPGSRPAGEPPAAAKNKKAPAKKPADDDDDASRPVDDAPPLPPPADLDDHEPGAMDDGPDDADLDEDDPGDEGDDLPF